MLYSDLYNFQYHIDPVAVLCFALYNFGALQVLLCYILLLVYSCRMMSLSSSTDGGASIFCHIFVMEINEQLTARGVQLIQTDFGPTLLLFLQFSSCALIQTDFAVFQPAALLLSLDLDGNLSNLQICTQTKQLNYSKHLIIAFKLSTYQTQDVHEMMIQVFKTDSIEHFLNGLFPAKGALPVIA